MSSLFVFHFVSVNWRNHFHASKKKENHSFSNFLLTAEILFILSCRSSLLSHCIYLFVMAHASLLKSDLLFSSIINILCCWIIFCCHFGNGLYLIKAVLKSLRSSLDCWPNSSLPLPLYLACCGMAPCQGSAEQRLCFLLFICCLLLQFFTITI